MSTKPSLFLGRSGCRLTVGLPSCSYSLRRSTGFGGGSSTANVMWQEVGESGKGESERRESGW
jgi:hypothetical protein